MAPANKITAETVRADFNDLLSVVHYTRAAHELGLWASERVWIERYLTDRTAPLLEAGCGAGRVTLGLWQLGYPNLTAFDPPPSEVTLPPVEGLAIEQRHRGRRADQGEQEKPSREETRAHKGVAPP